MANEEILPEIKRGDERATLTRIVLNFERCLNAENLMLAGRLEVRFGLLVRRMLMGDIAVNVEYQTHHILGNIYERELAARDVMQSSSERPSSQGTTSSMNDAVSSAPTSLEYQDYHSSESSMDPRLNSKSLSFEEEADLDSFSQPDIDPEEHDNGRITPSCVERLTRMSIFAGDFGNQGGSCNTTGEKRRRETDEMLDARDPKRQNTNNPSDEIQTAEDQENSQNSQNSLTFSMSL